VKPWSSSFNDWINSKRRWDVSRFHYHVRLNRITVNGSCAVDKRGRRKEKNCSVRTGDTAAFEVDSPRVGCPNLLALTRSRNASTTTAPSWPCGALSKRRQVDGERSFGRDRHSPSLPWLSSRWRYPSGRQGFRSQADPSAQVSEDSSACPRGDRWRIEEPNTGRIQLRWAGKATIRAEDTPTTENDIYPSSAAVMSYTASSIGGNSSTNVLGLTIRTP